MLDDGFSYDTEFGRTEKAFAEIEELAYCLDTYYTLVAYDSDRNGLSEN